MCFEKRPIFKKTKRDLFWKETYFEFVVFEFYFVCQTLVKPNPTQQSCDRAALQKNYLHPTIPHIHMPFSSTVLPFSSTVWSYHRPASCIGARVSLSEVTSDSEIGGTIEEHTRIWRCPLRNTHACSGHVTDKSWHHREFIDDGCRLGWGISIVTTNEPWFPITHLAWSISNLLYLCLYSLRPRWEPAGVKAPRPTFPMIKLAWPNCSAICRADSRANLRFWRSNSVIDLFLLIPGLWHQNISSTEKKNWKNVWEKCLEFVGWWEKCFLVNNDKQWQQWQTMQTMTNNDNNDKQWQTMTTMTNNYNNDNDDKQLQQWQKRQNDKMVYEV